MSSLLSGLATVLFICWELYINDVEYKHIKRYQTESGCYKAAKPLSRIRGIAIFCTEIDNPYLNRYVDFHNELGYNKDQNHWNNAHNIDMPHEFIGYNKNNEVVIINTIPYSHSCFVSTADHNSLLNEYIKIYICKNANENKEYFKEAVRGVLVNICSKLCKEYNLKPSQIILDAELDNSISNNCSEWFSQNEYSIEQLRFDVKCRSTAIMLFAEDYYKVVGWFKKILKRK